MTASAALAAAVISALRADATIASLVGASVVDVPSARDEKPYISLGPAQFEPLRRDGFTARRDVLQIDIWCEDGLRRQPCKEITDAVVAALDGAALDLAHPHDLARCDVVLVRIIDDPDGITTHGIVQIETEVTG